MSVYTEERVPGAGKNMTARITCFVLIHASRNFPHAKDVLAALKMGLV
jgi:hypothetical protein